jgi:transposase
LLWAELGVFLLPVPVAETGRVTERLRVREIDDDEGRRLVRIVRRGSGSVVTWRRAQMVLLSAQGTDVAAIARVAFTSEDRVRDVIRNFNADGFDSLYPRYKGGRPPKFTLGQRREIKKIAKSRPMDYDLPFSAWSLAKLADFLVAEGVVEDISHRLHRTFFIDSHNQRLAIIPLARRTAARYAFSWNFSITQCDPLCQLTSIRSVTDVSG